MKKAIPLPRRPGGPSPSGVVLHSRQAARAAIRPSSLPTAATQRPAHTGRSRKAIPCAGSAKFEPAGPGRRRPASARGRGCGACGWGGRAGATRTSSGAASSAGLTASSSLGCHERQAAAVEEAAGG